MSWCPSAPRRRPGPVRESVRSSLLDPWVWRPLRASAYKNASRSAIGLAPFPGFHPLFGFKVFVPPVVSLLLVSQVSRRTVSVLLFSPRLDPAFIPAWNSANTHSLTHLHPISERTPTTSFSATTIHKPVLPVAVKTEPPHPVRYAIEDTSAGPRHFYSFHPLQPSQCSPTTPP